MLQNISAPLFQDYTRIGRIIGFLIRSTWVLVGGLVCFAAFIFLLLAFILIALLPLLIIVEITFGIINLVA